VKILKRLILGLTILAVLLIGGVFLAVNLIDPNDYKDKIQALALEKTGRNLSIEGDIALRYFPWIGFSLGAISMANPDGFGDSAFVEIDSAQVKVKLLPLLKKSITVDSVELAGLNLDLQRAADGSTNWDDLGAEQNDAGTESSEKTDAVDIEAGETPAIQDLSIGAITITDARVNWLDKQNGGDARLSNFNLTTNAIELGKPFSLTTNFNVDSSSIGVNAQVEGTGDISVDLDNEQYQISNLKLATSASGDAVPLKDFTLDLAGDLSADLLAQTASVKSLTVNSAGIALSGDAKITDLSGNPTINTTLTSNEFSPRKLAKELGIEMPVTQDTQVLNAASASLTFSGSAKAATLGSMTVKLDDTTFSGNASLPDLTRTTPPVRFEFLVDAIDLDRYLPPTTDTDTETNNSTTSTAENDAASGDEPIDLPVDMLKQLDIDGVFKVGKLKLSNLSTSDIEVPVTASSGVISLNDVKATMYNGSMVSSVAIDVNNANPAYKISTSVDKVQAEPLLQDLMQDTAPLSGEAIVSTNLTTTGNTINQLTENLNGQFTSDFTNGAINGINIGYQLRRAKAFFSRAEEPVENSLAKTDFSTLHLSALIDAGVIQSDDLDIRAPALRISGTGNVDLPNETVDYTVNPKVVDSIEGQGGKDLKDLRGVSLNVPIRGTFDELSEDFGGTIFAAMKKDFNGQARERASALAKQERDKIKAEAKEKADAAKREAEEKLRAEQARAEEAAKAKIDEQKAKLDEAKDEIKDRAKDKLKSLFK